MNNTLPFLEGAKERKERVRCAERGFREGS
jgi:hypothetical protein